MEASVEEQVRRAAAELPLANRGGEGAAQASTVVAYPVPWGYALPPLPPGPGLNQVLHPDRGRDTLRGLARLRIATATAICASALTAAVGVLALSLALNPTLAPGILSLPPALGLLLVSFLVQLVAVAFGWSAFEDIADAAPSISHEHTESSRRAVHLMYLSAAAWAIGGLAGLAVFGAYFSSGPGSMPFGQLPREAVLSIVVSFALTGVAVNALIALSMQVLIARLLTDKGRRLKPLFYQLALGGTIASVAVSLVCNLVLASVDVFGLVAIVSVLSLSVYWSQIAEAERGTAAMAASRSNDPDSIVPTDPAFAGAEV